MNELLFVCPFYFLSFIDLYNLNIGDRARKSKGKEASFVYLLEILREISGLLLSLLLH